MRPFRLTLILLLVGLQIIGLHAQAAAPTGARLDTPPYAARGPYSVGKGWFMLDKGTSKSLLLVAWYPALKSEGSETGAALAVPDEYQFPNMKNMQKVPGWGDAAPYAVPDISGAPYPLVIFSPGYSTPASPYVGQEEHLASYGFVVLADALGSDTAVWKHFMTRPVLTHREIDFAERINGRDGGFKGLIDTKHVGLAGHSSGGYTALAAAGAQVNFGWFETWCTDHKASPDAQWACPDVLAHKQDMLALAGLESMPQALWPGQGDARVSAVIMETGGAFLFGPSGLAPVTIPVMVQVGSQDTYAPPEWNAYLAYDKVSSTQKALVVFVDAGHATFADVSGPAHDLINHFTTAFLLDMLKGDKDAHKALLPDAVKFPGIEYKTTMK